MKPVILTALALGLGAGQTLSTDYARERTLAVSVTSTTSTETVAMEVFIDGEPMNRGGRGGGGGGSTSERSYSWTDTVVESKDGAPVKVKRVFGEATASSTMMMRDEEMTNDAESAFSGAIVMIDASGDEPTYEVVEGGADLTEEQLAALMPTLAIDALLPDDEVEPGDSWDLEGEALLTALHSKLERQLFRRQAPEGGADGGQRGGRGGRGGMRGAGGGGGGLEALAEGDWDAKATLAEETEEVDGLECLIIKLEAEVSGDMPEQQFGGGRRGRDRAFAPELDRAPLESTYEAEFEGRLAWSVAEARPVRLELTGKMTIVQDTERETQRGSMQMHSERETTFEMTAEVTAGAKGL